jgi:hypothetical protein
MQTLRIARGVLSRPLGIRQAVRPSRQKKRNALIVASVADLIQLALAPLFVEGALSPFDFALDVVTAIALMQMLGWRWRTALALGLELVPGLAVFPTWTAMVATLPVAEDALAADARLTVR